MLTCYKRLNLEEGITKCNCSICHKSGFFGKRADPFDSLKVTQGTSPLTSHHPHHTTIPHHPGKEPVQPITIAHIIHTMSIGKEELSEYRFNSNAIPHYFCKNCGVKVYAYGNIPGMLK